MDRDGLFLRTLEDLEARVERGADQYDVLMSAGLLRKLLIDSPSLTDQVNRERRIQIRYRINAQRPIWEIAGGPPADYWSIQDGLDSETALLRPEVRDVGIDELLATTIMLVRGRAITVKDTIDHTSHVLGAVHPGEPHPKRRDAAALLEDIGRYEMGGYRPDIGSLQAIGRIVLRALAPLRERIEDERGENQ
jgi:hypothetical protein